MFFGVLRLVEGFHLREGMIRRLPKAAYHSKSKIRAGFLRIFSCEKNVFEKVERKVVMIWLCPSYP